MDYNINWFENRVKLTPNAVAIIDSDTDDAWTYEQLQQRVTKMVNYFHLHDVRKGDRVAILAPNHIGYFDFLFAAMKIGAIFLPINWRLSEAELEYLLQDAEPKIIGVAPALAGKISILPNNASFINISHNQYIDHLPSKQMTVTTILNEADPLVMIYTGGTTGKPKGVILSHRSILWNAFNTIISWDLNSEDTTLTCLPMSHTGGLNVYTLPLLLAGGKVVIASEFHAEKAVSDLVKYKCTVVLFVPTMYHMMIQTDAFKQTTFRDMKVFVSGGAPCPHKIYEAFAEKGLAFKEGYGLTEAGPNNFYIHPSVAGAKLGSVGKPMLFNDIRIMNEHGEATEINEVGELLIRGNHAFEYYWNKPEETKQTIVNGWIHTGDLARKDQDGYVYIVGRKKDMIITGGENVYPLEIEQWLEAHSNIDEAAVIGLPEEKWGEVVTAFVVLKNKMTETELETYCNQKLTRYKVPKKFFIIAALPKTAIGKINKVALQKVNE
ncbi:long-chain fatty acid--CoA ligase [Oceanobacillus arenosus]|uniref:Long-chain fatty acid--CoA ligase n=1 Tax=Oceanobacillus arenosus TaxID=1229153 RepID=A0A3D8PWR4_9BACI|nr:long-chain fatty acid--CoA ligase [Oceanobacillus arenosus]RDW20212.1 long-chain fatty acid--CoA ligase [Oceanobacillus arenosus]